MLCKKKSKKIPSLTSVRYYTCQLPIKGPEFCSQTLICALPASPCPITITRGAMRGLARFQVVAEGHGGAWTNPDFCRLQPIKSSSALGLYDTPDFCLLSDQLPRLSQEVHDHTDIDMPSRPDFSLCSPGGSVYPLYRYRLLPILRDWIRQKGRYRYRVPACHCPVFL